MRSGLPKVVVNLLFPRRCPICDEIVPGGKNTICMPCYKKVRFVEPPRCAKCGKKLLSETTVCKDCEQGVHEFIRGRAMFEYASIKQSLYRFKYGGRQEYSAFYGEAVSLYLGEFLERVKPDALIPIPLSGQRLRKRGYNQALVLAREIGKRSQIPVFENLLLRRKNTAPLKLLNPKERQNNLKKAFIIGRNDVKLNTIIIIDDIYTTGSTIDEAARTLKGVGIENIYFVVLASGVGI